MHDKFGKPLKVGDRVRVEFVITELHEGGGDFCNVRIETVDGLPGNGLKSSISSINTKQLEKIDAIPE